MHLEQTQQFNFVIPEPFNFRLTVAKPAGWDWSTPGEIFENGALWTGVYHDNKPIGLKMSARARIVDVEAYSESELTSVELGSLKDRLTSGLGANEDLTGFYKFAEKDPVLSVTIKDLYGMRVGRLDDVFGRVILAILLQMAPLARSEKMMTALLEHYGTKITLDNREVTLWPRPEDIAQLSPEELMAKANLGYRAKRLVAAAQYLSEHPVSISELSLLPEEEVVKKLEEIPGIGEYSAGIIFSQSSAPLDSWSVVIMSELILGKTPSDPRREIAAVTAKLKERWGKWNWMSFVYILNDLEKLADTFKLTRIR